MTAFEVRLDPGQGIAGTIRKATDWRIFDPIGIPGLVTGSGAIVFHGGRTKRHGPPTVLVPPGKRSVAQDVLRWYDFDLEVIDEHPHGYLTPGGDLHIHDARFPGRQFAVSGNGAARVTPGDIDVATIPELLLLHAAHDDLRTDLGHLITTGESAGDHVSVNEAVERARRAYRLVNPYEGVLA